MAASAFGVTAPEQCELATQFLPGAVACCTNGSSETCNQALDERAIPALYSAVRLVADAFGPPGTAITEPAVRTAIANGIALLMLDVTTGFHFVLIDSVTGPTFDVADPKYPNPVAAGWDDVSTAYGNGKIAQAWRVHPR
jgi:hypothetical protein